MDENGYFWFLGRADEVLKVAGHRLGTIELENALITHPGGRRVRGRRGPGRGTGRGPVRGRRPPSGIRPFPELETALKAVVHAAIGGIAEPREVRFVAHLPKTRSGKIMRRVVAAIVRGQDVGDVSTLEDGATVDEVREAAASLRRAL